ncbi:t-SNARE family protein [Thecamonas trahens ATCC 50062]|uniref:t-SNARE family protein n=1 Tax=Thecamonas trahens ATCC 50062 TaxID=461836 RepID=A0A0L0DQQ4_THETB|nr:t-SNARE family protein [Thecamonas trahens ATCC 50062]KNC53768.1 t-SNARE family protein [Thecamonas trahens ATCC 50062]|eukprot:XP_013754330.1 t-SNARE family protein [Thecamonas trahens ATCC 50062]
MARWPVAGYYDPYSDDEYSLSDGPVGGRETGAAAGIPLEAVGVGGVGGESSKAPLSESSGGSESGGAENELAPFFQRVDVLKGLLARVQDNIERVAEQHGLSLGATSSEEAAQCSQVLADLMAETDKMTKSIRAKLKAMEKDNAAFAKAHKGSAEDRIRTNAYGALTRKFIAVMREYQELQTEYRNKYKDRVERQVRIVKRDATQDEIDEIVEGTGGSGVFAQMMLSSTASHAAAQNALADIQERHEDIVRLERSIAELHQLFVDMAVLVDAQGELLDQIEHSVAQSVGYTAKAVKELGKANKYQRKARKKMCACLVLGMVVLGAVLIPTLAVTLKNA